MPRDVEMRFDSTEAINSPSNRSDAPSLVKILYVLMSTPRLQDFEFQPFPLPVTLCRSTGRKMAMPFVPSTRCTTCAEEMHLTTQLRPVPKVTASRSFARDEDDDPDKSSKDIAVDQTHRPHRERFQPHSQEPPSVFKTPLWSTTGTPESDARPAFMMAKI
jgi:hypothetical protein